MDDLRVALVQTELHWENIEANLRMFDKHLEEIKADLIVLPEMFSTGFSMNVEQLAESMNGSAMNWLRQKATEKSCIITGSLILHEGEGKDRKYYNRLIWMCADGSYHVYDKKHLFSLSLEPKIYSPGRKRLIVTLKGWRICPLICYDLRFPVWSRNAINESREADFDVLTYSANWPSPRALAWKALLQARAIENQCYVIGVNRVGEDGTGFTYLGDSSAIDPLGHLLYRREHVSEVTTITLSYEEMIKVRRQFAFLKDADAFDLR